MDEEYFDLKELSRYSKISTRTLHRWLKHPTRPLPHRRIGKRVLISRREYDAWFYSFPQEDGPDAPDDRAAEIVRSIRGV